MADDKRMIKDWKMYREQALKMAEEGTIIVYGGFCQEMEETVLDCIQVARAKGKKQVTILINSDGGDIRTYTAIKGTMALSGMYFTGIVIGAASSAGFMLLQSCQRRFAIQGSRVMFHWGRVTINNGEQAAIWAGDNWPFEQLKAEKQQFIEFVSHRTGASIEKLSGYALYERSFPVEDALKEGFIDAVLPQLPDEFKIPDME